MRPTSVSGGSWLFDGAPGRPARHLRETRPHHVAVERHARQGDQRREQIEIHVAHRLDEPTRRGARQEAPAILASATTQHLTSERLQQLSDEVGPERSLLVLCASFRGNADDLPNLTVKKVPTAVLSRCEWGRDDYSLAVAELPDAPKPAGQQDLDL